MKKRAIFIIISLLTLSAQLSFGAPVIKAHLDSSTLIMGKIGTLQLLVEEPKDAKGYFELFRQLPERGYVGVCGDSIELRIPKVLDTIDAGINKKILYAVPVQAFDSGTYVLPEFAYIIGEDTARSNIVTLQVVPVNAKADEPINDYAGTADPEDPSWFDWVPDWVLDFWWLIIICIVLICVILYLLRRYKRVGHILPKKPEPTPYEEAIAALSELKKKKLWEQGFEKEYFTDLTEILRKYLYRRFNINAMEMTSREIIQSLAKNPETHDKRAYFRKILDMADFVKFAKVRPLPDDNIASFESAVRFVNETKPVPIEESPTSPDRTPDTKNRSAKGSAKKGGES